MEHSNSQSVDVQLEEVRVMAMDHTNLKYSSSLTMGIDEVLF
jgi:hypothetical protein